MRSLIEFLFGFKYIKKLYQKYYNDSELNENFWKKSLKILNIKYFILNGENIPNEGACIIVANHPFGILDGLIVCTAISLKRKDFKILINEEIAVVDHIKKHLFPLRFDGTKEAAKINIESKNKAIEYVNAGGLLIIFPSGEVATIENIFGKAVEKEWKTLLGSILRKVYCKILPIYFYGQNSFIFQIVGFCNYKLRRILFIKELLNKKNKNFKATCGKLIDSKIFHNKENIDIAKQLREVTLNLKN